MAMQRWCGLRGVAVLTVLLVACAALAAEEVAGFGAIRPSVAKAVKDAKAKLLKPKPDLPFNGKDLKGWQLKKHGRNKPHWVVGAAGLDEANPRRFVVSRKGKELINAEGRGVDIYSKYRHGDATLKIDVMVPRGSNSGIYVMGEYEVQVLDSFGRDKNPGAGDMGAIYGAAPPKKPKYKKPGEWQTFEIHFLAPRFDAKGKKTANAKFVKVLLNGRPIHQNVQMKGPTPGGVTGKEHATGPIMFQGDHGPVAYRNIHVFPLKPRKLTKSAK